MKVAIDIFWQSTFETKLKLKLCSEKTKLTNNYIHFAKMNLDLMATDIVKQGQIEPFLKKNKNLVFSICFSLLKHKHSIFSRIKNKTNPHERSFCRNKESCNAF